MILALDDEQCLDPGLAGAKAAWLARGRQAGLPVLPGVVIPAGVSKPVLARGVDVLEQRGSGGARLVISQSPLPDDLEQTLEKAVADLGEPMVVRSSSILEGSGEWSGAFTSYLEVYHGEVPKAVAGCWASAFTVATLERFAAAELDPRAAPMAVLVQPALDPDFGGTARIERGEVVVIGVAGSPAPLVQGWDPGTHARVSESGVVRGDDALQLMGEELIGRVASVLLAAHSEIGATGCEWAAAGGEVFLLQLLRTAEAPESTHMEMPPELDTEAALGLARLVRRFPGPLGEELVLPWAVGDPSGSIQPADPADVEPLEALRSAIDHAAALTAEVWGLPKPSAAAAARETLRALRGTDPGPALDALTSLRVPDPERARLIRSLLATVHDGLVRAEAVSRPELGWHFDSKRAAEILSKGRAAELRTRIGFDRWEPFDAAVVVTHGASASGVSAGPGIACGRFCFIDDPHRIDHFRPRDVVVATHPIPHLAALLWDASALVTTGGSPAAHLFESARALAIPAVCGVHLDEILEMPPGEATGKFSMAVDGNSSTVFVTSW